LPPTGTRVVKEDVIIGKITDIVQEGRVRTVDNSVTAKKACGVVDQVLLTDDMCGRRKVKVRTRDTRTPMIGSFFGGRALRRLLTLLFFQAINFPPATARRFAASAPPPTPVCLLTPSSPGNYRYDPECRKPSFHRLGHATGHCTFCFVLSTRLPH
jgi:hypothetical protein